MKSPILGGFSVARSVNAAANRMVNLFPESILDGGKEAAWLCRAPGLRWLASLGTGPIRGLWNSGDDGYAVSGNTLYRIKTNFTATSIGTVSNDGPVSMSDNGVQLFIACNGPSYIYNMSTGAFAQITDIDFPGAVTVGYLDGYFVFNPPNSQQVWVTSLLDGSSIDPLDFASAEGSPDQLISLIVDHREVWLFGTNTTEVWYNSGNPDFPLERIQGAFNEVGCAAPYSLAKLDNGVFWLGADARGQGIVYRSQGYAAKRVSTHSIEWHIQSYGDISDAIAYTYQQDGHAFYILTFPTANATWVYDVSTDVWHERAGFADDRFIRHRSNCQMAFADMIVVGDYENGNIYAFDLTKYSDDIHIQKWVRSWRALPTGQNNLNRTAQHSLQLDAQAGVGDVEPDLEPTVTLLLCEDEDPLLTEDNDQLITNVTFPHGALVEWVEVKLLTEGGNVLLTESGQDIIVSADYEVVVPPPSVMLRWSDDGGHTWSNEHWRSMGKLGEYGNRIIWRRLGMTTKLRDRVYEISGTDPVKIAIMGAELIMSPTNS